jgi:hypothetical protein
MNGQETGPISGRRAFLKAVMPGGALLCLGGPCLLRAFQAEEKAIAAGQKHKFLNSDAFRSSRTRGRSPGWRGTAAGTAPAAMIE